MNPFDNLKHDIKMGMEIEQRKRHDEEKLRKLRPPRKPSNFYLSVGAFLERTKPIWLTARKGIRVLVAYLKHDIEKLKGG